MKKMKDLSILARVADTLTGAGRAAMMLLMMLFTMTAQTAWAGDGDIIYVSNTGDDTNDGSSEATALATIGKAVENANDGETIFIKDGEYTEENTITLEKSLSFEGES